ncbi:hypothetical protein FEM48_Zijuj01G0180100 [Ziziphus jujuba var. spinosa]|uniref:NADP-dependent oxidoreductase domain-containing protein n=1 Tax=Ziziphus jujuba var. spinosa TaxID=714518 RepID=A0A978W2R3_ZIZJJ|nr:hypothetical protein FEM48_Zijuj01G0180100 [Ziziphus jujuba var. spinosa]
MTTAGSECIPAVVLSSSVGHRAMPVLGFGMASFSSDLDLLRTAVLEAIKLGYRHFDTAAMYGSEQTLGEAIAEALKHGLVGSQNELFITTKLWCNDAHPSLLIPALKKSLQNLQLEYLDLYLVHWPFNARPGKLEYSIKEEDVMPLDYNSVWADMEESRRLGLTRSIGVRNFTTKKLQNLVEMNPIWQQKKLIQFCKANNITVTACSPLGAKGTAWGSNHVMDNQVLEDIAKAHGKSIAHCSCIILSSSLQCLLASFDPTIVIFIASTGSSHEAWLNLATMYAKPSNGRIMSIRETLSKDDKSISDYMEIVQSFANSPTLAGGPLGQDEIMFHILNGLGPNYKEISPAIQARDSSITSAELHDKFADYEAFMNQNRSTTGYVFLIIVNYASRGGQYSPQP